MLEVSKNKLNIKTSQGLPKLQVDKMKKNKCTARIILTRAVRSFRTSPAC